MRIVSPKIVLLVIVVLLVVVLKTFSMAFAAASEQVILVLPLQINAEEPTDFLKKGDVINEINVRCHFVDVIDLDKDGQKEICITGVNENQLKGMRYTKDDGYQLSRLFFQQRLMTTQADQDRRTGLVVAKNIDANQGLLNHSRSYRKSHIDVLVWNQIGLVALEKSQTLSGYISDFGIGDTDTNGRPEVVFALVTATAVLKSHRSQIFAKSLVDVNRSL